MREPVLEPPDPKECWSCGCYEGQEHYLGCNAVNVDEGFDGILGEG